MNDSSPHPVGPSSTGSRARPRARIWRDLWENSGMLFVFLAMYIAAAIFVPNFATARNMQALALSVSSVGIVACTMLFCLAAGHFDLSVEAVVAMAGVVAAVVINGTGSVTLGIAAALAGGTVVGLINGMVIAKLRINALITTLATMQIVRGLGYMVSEGKAVGISEESFFALGNSHWLRVPMPVWIMAACFVVAGLLLRHTTFGRNTLAVGGNEEAARLAGIAVDRVKIAIFVLQGLIAAFAGVVMASRMTSGQPNSSLGFALDVIAACVLGGVSLSGGVGTVLGTLIGVLIMGTVTDVLQLYNVDWYYRYIASGGVLLAAVIFDRLRRRR